MSISFKTKLHFISHKLIPKILQWIGAITVLGFIFLLILISNHEFFLEKLGDFLVIDQKPVSSDIIIILSGNDQDERVMYGVTLFKEGYANKLLMTGGRGGLLRKSCPEIMRDQAIALGVSKEAILVEEKSATTFENAKYTLQILKAEGYKSAIIVTSAFHTRRSKNFFEPFFSKENVNFVICAVPNTLGLGKWWRDDLKAQDIFTEYIKLLYYYLFQEISFKGNR